MNLNTNLILSIIFVIYVSFLSFSTQQMEIPEYCIQERPEKIKEELGCLKHSDVKDFCSTIQCEPIEPENCIEDEKTAIVQNITGRGCCPACVQYIDEDENCEIRSKLKRCRNGLYCNPSTKKCNLPPQTKRCMKEVHNRRLVANERISFYIEGKERVKKPVYFELKYATDIEYPTCAAQSGEYEPKQCRGSKCFCVRPNDGRPTFGLTVKDSADGSAKNVTCECAEQFRKELDSGQGSQDRAYMEHYAQIHSKCDYAGNYEKLQCINSTCFCADEQTGRPTNDRVAIYGSLLTLPCFDKEKSKTLGSKDSDIYYQNECERQLLRTQQMSLHFIDKGTDLIGLDKIRCSFDGKFAPKQCKPESCNCVKPDDAGIAMPGLFASDRMGGKDSEMDCLCARQVYYANMEKKGFDRPQCEGNGNFKAYQSFDSGIKTYCVDENGARISDVVRSNCFDQFGKDIDPGLANLREYICQAMRKVLTDEKMELGDYYTFNMTSKTYAKLNDKPNEDDLYCKNSVLDECRCDIAKSS